MKIRALLFAFLLLLAFSGYSMAQENEESLVTMDLTHSHSTYVAGDSYPMVLSVRIKQGYHINSTEPESPELIPTRLTLSAPDGISLAKYIVPPVRYHKMPDEEKAWAVWNGQVAFTPVVKIAGTVKPGNYNLIFELYYQACDDQICQMPTTQELSVMIEVIAP